MILTKSRFVLDPILSRHPKDMLRFCFAIPASPTDGFYSQVAMFRLALNELGGNYKQADIILSLGDEMITELPEKWARAFNDGVKLSWVDPAYYKKVGMRAQGDNRWWQNYDDYDLIIFCDADTILLKSIDNMLSNVHKSNSAAGVIAHFPFPHPDDAHPSNLWHTYAKMFVGRPISLDYQYTLITGDSSEDAKCPFYVNFGFVIMPMPVFRKIRNTYLEVRAKISPLLTDPRFGGQISLTLSLLKHEIPVHSLGMHYNFPNDPVADELYPAQLEQVCVMHYLRTEKFDRQKIFATEDAFNEFLLLELEGSNKIFQEYIRSITQGVYPFTDIENIHLKTADNGQSLQNVPTQTGKRHNRVKKRIEKGKKSETPFRKVYSILTHPRNRLEQLLRFFLEVFILPVMRFKNSGRLKWNLDLIKSSNLFDAAWYLTENPDVAKAKMDPFLHYLNHGGFEGRDPSPIFNSRFYLDSNEDVKNAGINPLLHYLKYGKREGRLARPSRNVT